MQVSRRLGRVAPTSDTAEHGSKRLWASYDLVNVFRISWERARVLSLHLPPWSYLPGDPSDVRIRLLTPSDHLAHLPSL